jgi:hypothetical protein
LLALLYPLSQSAASNQLPNRYTYSFTAHKKDMIKSPFCCGGENHQQAGIGDGYP